MTVHKAQGQTIPVLEVDCYSFFAPVQLGVAIGRAVSSNNLRVRNFHTGCSTLKHLPQVYNFYEKLNMVHYFQACCHSVARVWNQFANENADSREQSNGNPWFNVDYTASLEEPHPDPHNEDLINDIDCTPPDGLVVPRNRLLCFISYIQRKLNSLLPPAGKNKESWSVAYRLFHQFLLSTECKKQICLLLSTNTVSPACNGFATRFAFKIHDVTVARRADEVRQDQNTKEKYASAVSDITDAGKVKIRYIAGACLATVSKRLKSKALSNINTVHSDRRRQAYRQQKLLACFRINESEL